MGFQRSMQKGEARRALSGTRHGQGVLLRQAGLLETDTKEAAGLMEKSCERWPYSSELESCRRTSLDVGRLVDERFDNLADVLPFPSRLPPKFGPSPRVHLVPILRHIVCNLEDVKLALRERRFSTLLHDWLRTIIPYSKGCHADAPLPLPLKESGFNISEPSQDMVCSRAILPARNSASLNASGTKNPSF